MPESRQPVAAPLQSQIWPAGGRHLWPSGGVSESHSHQHGHLVYAATGVLAVVTAGGTSVVPADRIGWTPAGIAHRHRAHGDTDMRILFVTPELARHLPDRPAVFLASGVARAVTLALTGGDDDPATARTDTARARLLRVLVDELRDTSEQRLHLPEPRDDRLRALAAMLADDPGENASLAELGRAVGASSRTLSRLLHDELGMTFREWRTHLRVYHALVLLAEGLDTTQTSFRCGWANPSGFITAFAGIVGTTPGRYRAGGPHPPG
ncbi:AraC family transcriptional regulator [Cellulomonas alba]|uniref:Helix-turn-helix transcriptional regulator n=1 Tax=Cellulomonas alba TaxID=3053467 RepID=A0ABT7SFM7_9CELL|nr:helix-turn-helix transcriptional regulator [Cellulomonas alba]MDM7854992.1 helix-turn-helix transcriptional regulator [Cellulomonas alba]